MDLTAFSADVRHFGVTRALLRAGYYRAHATCGLRILRFLVMESADVNRAVLARAVPYECRMLDYDEVAPLLPAVSASVMGATPRRGDLCFAISDGTTVASVGWYTSRPTTVLGTFTFRFAPGYVYMYGGYTLPRYRGLRLHGIGLARASEALAARGYAGIVSVAERVNFASLASCARTGLRPCGTALAASIDGRTFVRQSAAAARYGLQLVPVAPDGVRQAPA